VSKIVKGHKYWYWQDNRTRKQSYLGPDFPYMQVVIGGYKEALAEILKRVA